jgi:hypothetical protein
MESDEESQRVDRLLPDPPTVTSVADKWINMESDHPSPSQSPTPSSKLGVAEHMASDDKSEQPLPAVASIADKWINMDSDHEATQLSPSSVLQSPPMASKQDVGQRWIDMVSDDERESPMQQSLSQFGIADKWINMESDEEIVGADAVGISDHDTSDNRTNDGSDSDEDENDEDADGDDEDEDDDDADGDDEDEDDDDPPSAGPSHALNFTATPSRLNLTPRKFHSDEFDMLPIQLFDLDYLQMKMAEAEENGD